nr:MAG TPA: hypothetical protein [Inoviridae sp.]DAS81214.1 MAG TPA: hypothetical protein [Inoviridae sp.]
MADVLRTTQGRRRSRGRMMPRLRGAPPRQGRRNTPEQGISH